ncbi:MAG: inositol-3-phosphate synthase [Spirochaetota bacterium]|nr:inositol-3-phosphate synthase [Spirochaetota bacterium]
MNKIKVGIVGVGNCASSLVQGTIYYADRNSEIPGLITKNFGGYYAADIDFVSAFDIDRRKVGKDLSQAIFEKPNCTTIFEKNIPHLNCTVQMGYVLDGVAEHLTKYPEDDRICPMKDVYISYNEAKSEIVRVLQDTNTEILVNFLPVGSENAARFYAECCLEAGVAMVNAMPVFLSQIYGDQFKEAGLPILGDDVKSQVGATIVHRVLTKLFEDRGQKIKKTYQINVGGNMDFLNMVDRTRLESKKISKTRAVTSQIEAGINDNDIYVGPSDYVPWLNDNKVCFIRMEGEQYGGLPMNIELRLSVEDSPNSAGVITDAIRAAKVALDCKLSGPIIEASAYLFKSPIRQFDDATARIMLRDFAKKISLENNTTQNTEKKSSHISS